MGEPHALFVLKQEGGVDGEGQAGVEFEPIVPPGDICEEVSDWLDD